MAYGKMDRIPQSTAFVGEDAVREAEPISGSWWQHLVAGGCAGAVSRTLTAPLDRIKVFLQVHPNHQFQGISSCVTHMLHEGGFQSFWRGNGINVLKITPESALKFMAYDQVKRMIRENKKSQELIIYERFFAGSIAGGFSQSIIYPLEVLKTRLALRKTGEVHTIWKAFNQIYRNEGFLSFYRGYLPNLLGIIPYAGIELAVYETLKKFYSTKHLDYHNQPPILLVLWCGTVSCTAGQLITYPLALVRTKLQATAVIPTLLAHATMLGIIRSTVQDEGYRGLYRGILPNLLKVIPTVSLSFLVYEKTHSYLCGRCKKDI